MRGARRWMGMPMSRGARRATSGSVQKRTWMGCAVDLLDLGWLTLGRVRHGSATVWPRKASAKPGCHTELAGPYKPGCSGRMRPRLGLSLSFLISTRCIYLDGFLYVFLIGSLELQYNKIHCSCSSSQHKDLDKNERAADQTGPDHSLDDCKWMQNPGPESTGTSHASRFSGSSHISYSSQHAKSSQRSPSASGGKVAESKINTHSQYNNNRYRSYPRRPFRRPSSNYTSTSSHHGT